MRCADEDGPRSDLYVVDVVHGAREIDRLLAPDDDLEPDAISIMSYFRSDYANQTI